MSRIDPSLDCVQSPVWVALILGLVSDGEIKNANLVGMKSEMSESESCDSKNERGEENGEFEIFDSFENDHNLVLMSEFSQKMWQNGRDRFFEMK